ncbi:probable WRKY transcription factor 3 [Impatiens glandulifera]|uniref:probable WRKY transcription factor 3 n=1 Tax=Impatiens glandulifera TaxID=253017 RepID=UPI001FB1118E|nr:probable WRKY transcription factor 3 [Impatiens glandulifera]
MGQKSGISKPDHGPPLPAISVPSRASFDSLFAYGTGCSPGPMTLVSNFFSDHFQDVGSASFSQLLAGAIASPKVNFLDNNNTNNNNSSSNERSSESVSERQLGFQQNRPTSLMIAQSPLFTVPPGFSPSGLLDSPSFFSLCQSPFGISHQQALAQVTAQAALSQQTYMPIQQDNQQNQQSFASIESFLSNQSFDFDPTMGKEITISDPESSVMESSEVTQSDRKTLPPLPAVDRPANDGYNWRKYGQKQVKASEYPRSYYKCTYLNCPVKKKVERNFDGQITEITYRGQHIHELPHPDKLTKSNLYTEGSMDETETRKSIGTVPASSSQLVTSYNEVGIRRDEIRLDEDDDEDEEPNPKRRQSGNGDVGGTSYVVSSQKTVNESRIVVQTRSEVDLLDDGYKWRKYGQKLVKGNSYPRSYYKCTSAGCNVRKHVERASADPKAVVTTYEGKHSHDIPVAGARNGGGGGTNSAMQLKQKRAAAGKKQQMLIGDIIGGGGGQLLLKEEQITTA